MHFRLLDRCPHHVADQVLDLFLVIGDVRDHALGIGDGVVIHGQGVVVALRDGVAGDLAGEIAFTERPHGIVEGKLLLRRLEKPASFLAYLVEGIVGGFLGVEGICPLQLLEILDDVVAVALGVVQDLIGLNLAPEFRDVESIVPGFRESGTKALKALGDVGTEFLGPRLDMLIVVGKPRIGRDLGDAAGIGDGCHHASIASINL